MSYILATVSCLFGILIGACLTESTPFHVARMEYGDSIPGALIYAGGCIIEPTILCFDD